MPQSAASPSTVMRENSTPPGAYPAGYMAESSPDSATSALSRRSWLAYTENKTPVSALPVALV